MTIHELLRRFDNPRKQGKGWQVRCPAHDDQKASLSVSEGRKGDIVLFCHAGCETKTICSLLDVPLASLFSDQIKGKPRRQVAQVYDYLDEDGTLLFQTIRYEPKGFSQRRADGRGRWVYNLNGVRRALYRLPDLMKAHPAATVFICEGEKDADNLQALGLIATTSPMGAGKWRNEYAAFLRDRDVVILPDNDATGHTHADTIARSLYRIARSVRILPLPELPAKGDVSDWIDADGDAESLCVMAEKTPEWAPTTDAAVSLKIESASSERAPLILHTWAELESLELPEGEKIIHEVERGEIAMLAAVTNKGKSTLVRNLALRLTCGRSFSLLTTGGVKQRVLLVDFETRLARLQRDLRQMSRELTNEEQTDLRHNLAIICDQRINDEPLMLSDPDHLRWLILNARDFRADLIIIDTVSAAFALRDENSNAEVGSRICRPLTQLARETNAAVVFIHHIGKARMEEGHTAEEAHRARGASAYSQYATTIFNLKQDNSDKNRVVLTLAKVKGEQLDDVVLELDRDARWFRQTGISISQVPTSYALVMNLFSEDRIMRTHEVIAALTGQVAERTVKSCLSDGIRKGDLRSPQRGHFQRNAESAGRTSAAQIALPVNDLLHIQKDANLAH